MTLNPMQFPDEFSNDHPHQLRMFMTPTEIKSQYQVLPGDRKEKMRYETDDDGYRTQVGTGKYETNDAAWKRKAKEAHGRGGNKRRGDPGLAESVAAKGVKKVVHLAVTDSTTYPATLGGQLGGQRTRQADASDGRPAVVGGHHRIATAAESRPDDLIPVMHHNDLWNAQGRDKPMVMGMRKPAAWETAYRSKYS
jgi:hypothetical protein